MCPTNHHIEQKPFCLIASKSPSAHTCTHTTAMLLTEIPAQATSPIPQHTPPPPVFPPICYAPGASYPHGSHACGACMPPLPCPPTTFRNASITSCMRANDYELHACDIEQAFLQADNLSEGVNGRYFIQPPPGSPDANDRDVVYEVRRPLYGTLYGNPSSPRALHKTLGA